MLLKGTAVMMYSQTGRVHAPGRQKSASRINGRI